MEAGLDRLSTDVGELTDLENHVRAHPIAALGLALSGGAIAGASLTRLAATGGIQGAQLKQPLVRIARRALLASLLARFGDLR